MSNNTKSDCLVTADDVQWFKDEVDRGNFETRVLELVDQEPELAIFIADPYANTLDRLQDAGITDQRLAALHQDLTLLTWASALLLSKAHRRQWSDFLPAENVADLQSGGGEP